MGEEMYLVWSHEHGAWWRPNSCGYTRRHEDAGRYPRAEAIRICALARDGWGSKGVPAEMPVREADVQECVASFDRMMGAIR